MPNIWKAQSKVNNKIKRNNHDLSKKSNISLKFGTLYPVFCKKVFPGDSFSIDTAFNLKLQPVIFPVQTKMRAHMHYFYVRNKNLWSGWEDWITGLRTNEETPHPYLSVRDSDIKTSSIHDFLGIPTSVASSGVVKTRMFFYTEPLPPFLNIVRYAYGSGFASENLWAATTPSPVVDPGQFPSRYAVWAVPLRSGVTGDKITFDLVDDSESHESSSFFNDFVQSDAVRCDVYSAASNSVDDLKTSTIEFSIDSDDDPNVHYTTRYTIDGQNAITRKPSKITDCVNSIFNDGRVPVLVFYLDCATLEVQFDEVPRFNAGNLSILYDAVDTQVNDYSKLGIDLFSRHLHLNALPYRAYESIYNAFYRNTQVDPLIINGRTEYNKFVENMGDGADDFNYHLHQRNYELDFLTSALPSPQQGVAPLVGMTALGDITIEDENGITTAKATVDDDGTITDVVVTSPAASIEHQRVAMSLAQFGMNIQDFRNVNAYLRLLETSIRKGYRYIENILGHWGVAPKHNTLDMPEFIGGFSRDVQVSTVVSSADTLGSDGLSLGDYGGYAQLVGGSKSPVRHFFDDHGFIIGILSVVPTPCYSQLLPKQMIAPTSYLDYYFPEFDQIGYQPITYKEVAPIQSYLDSLSDPNKRLEDTFGYQRPNYDLVGDVDEVHGLFRTDFRNYVINRIFDTRPELGHDFISINPSEINQIFVDTNPDDDCIIGEIGFAVHTKRPVSRVVIPGLGH